jgi:hypothetical protein
MGEDDALVQLNADIAARETAGNRAWFENLLGPQFAMRRANLAHTTRAEFLARVEASAERSTDDIAVAHHTDLTAVVTCTVSMRQDDDTWGRVPQRAPVHPRRAPPHLAAARVGQRTRRQRLTQLRRTPPRVIRSAGSVAARQHVPDPPASVFGVNASRTSTRPTLRPGPQRTRPAGRCWARHHACPLVSPGYQCPNPRHRQPRTRILTRKAEQSGTLVLLDLSRGSGPRLSAISHSDDVHPQHPAPLNGEARDGHGHRPSTRRGEIDGLTRRQQQEDNRSKEQQNPEVVADPSPARPARVSPHGFAVLLHESSVLVGVGPPFPVVAWPSRAHAPNCTVKIIAKPAPTRRSSVRSGSAKLLGL